MGERGTVYLGMNKLVDTTARTFIASNGSLFTDNFQIMVLSDDVDPYPLCGTLNSTLFQLTLNVEARSNFGQGVLEIQTYETENTKVVKPELLSEMPTEVFATANWDILTPSPERRQIDNAMFDALRLTSSERDAVYEGVVELVDNRRRRAGSV